MTRRGFVAATEVVFALTMTACATARPSLWTSPGSGIVRALVVLEAAAALLVAQGLWTGRKWSWVAGMALGGVSTVEAWYAAVAFTFSYLGEGLPDHAGLALLTGGFALQTIVLALSVIELLSPHRSS